MKSRRGGCACRWGGDLLRGIFRRIRLGVMGIWSWVYYRSSLRTKILVPVFLVTLVIIGVLAWFSFINLRSTLTSIYEHRASSVAAIIAKSIQDKDYILYYAEQLDKDIETLLERYDSIVSITVVGMTGRGLRVVASVDPTRVGQLIPDEEQDKLSSLRETEISRVSIGGRNFLRVYQPLIIGSEPAGIVSLDMSLSEQQRYLSRLSLQLGLGSLVGFFVLGTLLHAILHVTVTRPVLRLARAAQAVSQRNLDVEVSAGPARRPGIRVRDEIARLIGVFNLMVRMIRSREKALSEMVMLDELTGAYNLSNFKRLTDLELKKGRRYKHPTSVILVEVQGIKDLPEEDKNKVLIATANFLMETLRTVDPVFRVSEDRFAVLLPETPPEGAQVAADRLKERSADLRSRFAFPVSLKVAAIGWGPEEAPEIEDALRQVLSLLDQG